MLFCCFLLAPSPLPVWIPNVISRPTDLGTTQSTCASTSDHKMSETRGTRPLHHTVASPFWLTVCVNSFIPVSRPRMPLSRQRVPLSATWTRRLWPSQRRLLELPGCLWLHHHHLHVRIRCFVGGRGAEYGMTGGKEVAWRAIFYLQCLIPEASEAIDHPTLPLADILALHGISQDMVDTQLHTSAPCTFLSSLPSTSASSGLPSNMYSTDDRPFPQHSTTSENTLSALSRCRCAYHWVWWTVGFGIGGGGAESCVCMSIHKFINSLSQPGDAKISAREREA